jgi:hypothetical protein
VSDCSAIERVTGEIGRAWIFKGTWVPIRALFENFEEPARIQDFLEWFQEVSGEQVVAGIRHAAA